MHLRAITFTCCVSDVIFKLKRLSLDDADKFLDQFETELISKEALYVSEHVCESI